MRNLTNLSAPRAIFLFDLFIHKDIDIYSHIYHLFTKCITKRNIRIILPFPSFIMSLITRARVKIPSGLQVIQRDYPISAQTMTRSKAHIPRPSAGVSQIPRDEGGGALKKKLSISHPFQRTLHNLFPKSVHGHPIILIIKEEYSLRENTV